MLSFNCLLNNTKLYNDLSQYVKKIMYERASKGQSVTISSIFMAARQNSTISDVDLNTVGEMYKAIAPQLKGMVSKGVFDSDFQVDKATGKVIDSQLKKIKSGKKTTTRQEIGQQMPSTSIMSDILKLFTSDYIDEKDLNNKTVMREMQDAIKKAAVALLKRENKRTDGMTTEQMLKEALRLDKLNVKDLKGNLNSMDDLFNQVTEEIDKVVKQLDASKRGMSVEKKAEIDMRIEQLNNYTENIKKGAYTLALSLSEQKKAIRDILKEKYGKDVRVNGVVKRVLDWNKLFLESKDFRKDIYDSLSTKGFSQQEIDKVADALETQYNSLRASSQWNNLNKRQQSKMLDDDAFLARAAATIVMSKDGGKYKVYSPSLRTNVADWEKWAEDHNGQTAAEFQAEVKSHIQNSQKLSADEYVMSQKDKDGKYYKKNDPSGAEVADWARYASDKKIDEQKARDNVEKRVADSASEYRRIISEIERQNNPTKKVTKGDLEKLSELSARHGFDSPLFNAKVYNMLGLTDADTEAARKIQEISDTVREVMDLGGKNSRITLKKLQDQVNHIISESQSDKSFILRLFKTIEWAMGNRNAYRISNLYNLMENSLSGVNQMLSIYTQAVDKKVARKEFGKMLNIAFDVALGGTHFDMTDTDKISYHAHEFRYDPNKSPLANIKPIMAMLPNLALGVLDSAAHAYTMRIMFFNSSVKFVTSQLKEKMRSDLQQQGVDKGRIEKLLSESESKFKKEAIDKVTDSLYDPTKEEQALKDAAKLLKLSTPNPSNVEIKREADNLMFQRLVTDGYMTQRQLEAIMKASDMAAKKSIGKEADFKWNPLAAGIEKINSGMKKKIREDLQEQNYKMAAVRILTNAMITKGLIPFINGASNWGVLAAKKTGIGLLRNWKWQTMLSTRENFRDQVENAAMLDDKQLYTAMESYNNRRNDIYLGLHGMMWTAITLIGAAALKAGSGDDDDFFSWFDDTAKEISKDKRKRKMLLRWLPPIVQVYNLVQDNAVGDSKMTNSIDLGGQLFGYGAMESPITKMFQYTSEKHKSAGAGQVLGAIFDVGAYWNAVNSFYDAFGEEQTNKAKSHDTWLGSEIGAEDNDFINGIISGMMGYGLNQDVNSFFDYRPSK